MKYRVRTTLGLAVACATAVLLLSPGPHSTTAAAPREEASGLTIDYPLDGTLFPPEIVPPTFHWTDGNDESTTWLITLEFADDLDRMSFVTREPRWTPGPADWKAIKRRSLEREAKVTVLGVDELAPGGRILSGGEVTLSTSRDEVGAPIFYREVNLPFIEAVKDPSRIRWRFGPISSPEQPPIVLEGLPVCGNCHSFSADGAVLGMDVDYANDKGSYVLTEVSEEVALDPGKIITWSDYRREDKQPTFGLLSQVSPDGKLAISTVKDRSVFVPKPGLLFSQLFFPVQGILAVYSRETGTFESLPGADDPRFVQSNPSWSPDGKYVVFARCEAYRLKHLDRQGRVLLTAEECREFLEEHKPFKFDLYHLPYNDGEGGQAEPIEGASNNGASNFFPRYSPDGKWIVFCKASNYMLLQPDSELTIIPAEGGQARRLRCNTTRMNSWHSWSPNGRWLVFSSKVNGPYTQLLLTHIDDEGRSTPPVLLSRFTAPDRAANIPEFVNTKPSAIKRIRERFVDDLSYRRAGDEFMKWGDPKAAIRAYRKALGLNPNSAAAHGKLGEALQTIGELEQATVHLAEAARLDPEDAGAQANVGAVLLRQERYREAIPYYTTALQLRPQDAGVLVELGRARFGLEEFEGAVKHWKEAERIRPGDADLHFDLGQAMSRLGKHAEACDHYSRAVRIEPSHAKARGNLGCALLENGRAKEAALHLTEALRLDPENAEFHYALGLARARQGKPGVAANHWSRAVQLEPDHVEAHLALGRLMAQLGRHDDAIGHLSSALRARPDQTRALLDLGASHAALGRFPEAISACEKALTLARAAGREPLARQIERRIELYRRKTSASRD